MLLIVTFMLVRGIGLDNSRSRLYGAEVDDKTACAFFPWPYHII